MRKKIIAANWKMNKTIQEAVDFVRGLRQNLRLFDDRICVICPPFTALMKVHEELQGSDIALGAQNFFWESDGAYTGETSIRMLKDVGCQYVIIGHSERRRILGETDSMIHKKVKKAFIDGLYPIVCVGETLEEREKGITFEIVRSQVMKDLEGLSGIEAKKCVLAYEPVWAIGTGRNATPAQAEEVHQFIRGVLNELFGWEVSDSLPIQYGGSVKTDNVDDLMSQENIDGALVGGASLDLKSFTRIVEYHIKKS